MDESVGDGIENAEKNKGRMLLQGQENLLRELKWLEKEKRLDMKDGEINTNMVKDG
ncbi:MAG: hypothetical protein H5T45_06570 [Thermoplasmatales archaeon]|nr:hypothetical protein [Thermoplasmatales archaeon]